MSKPIYVKSRLHLPDTVEQTEIKGKRLNHTIIDPIPDAILTADWHLREDTPICRADNFWETQWKKVDFISELQRKYNCPVLNAGDLFDHWKPSPYLLSVTIEHLPKQFYTVYGNHDLPQHSMELKHKSGIHVLSKAGVLTVLPHGHLDEIPTKQSVSFKISERKIYVWHTFVYTGKEPFPGAKGKARNIMNKYKQFDLIVTGDNHQSFTYQLDKRLLVNCGSLMRQDASQIEFSPKVWLYFASTNEVTPIIIPHDADAVTREHLNVETDERDEKLEAFINTIKSDENNNFLSFEDNIKRYLSTIKVNKEVKIIINKSIDLQEL